MDVSNESPVLLDRFLDDAIEIDIDAISDGESLLLLCNILSKLFTLVILPVHCHPIPSRKVCWIPLESRSKT